MNRTRYLPKSGSRLCVATIAITVIAMLAFSPGQVQAEGLDPSQAAITATVEPSVPAVPSSDPTEAAPTPATPSAELAPAAGEPAPVAGESARGILAQRYVLARLPNAKAAGTERQYLESNTDLTGLQRFDSFRLRFQVRNPDANPAELHAQLQVRRLPVGAFADVSPDAGPAGAFTITQEWVPSSGPHGGTEQGPEEEAIAVSDLRIPRADDAEEPTEGRHSMGPNPDRRISLPPHSYTEQEFTVHVTLDAHFDSAYEFRLTNAGEELIGKAATVTTGSEPEVTVSLGQREGTPVVGTGKLPRKAIRVAGYRSAQVAMKATEDTPYLLVSARTVGVGAATGPHTASATMMPDSCAPCHRGHTASGSALLAQSTTGADSKLCFNCHGNPNVGSVSNVEKQYQQDYAGTAIPVNDPNTRSYYSHDARQQLPTPAELNTQSVLHTLASQNEFGGSLVAPISNRHSECADCHNPHDATSTDSAQADVSDPWTPSGRLGRISGVSVVNGAAGTAPTYTFLDGQTQPITAEYQLCFKCHSGATKLPANTIAQGGTVNFAPSQYYLDKGVEFNPTGATATTPVVSFHPIEAAGSNQTTAMGNNLAGTSPFKRWNFLKTGTVRCLNCHVNPSELPAPPTANPPAGVDSPPHASPNRGILLANYQDQTLKPAGEAYSAGQFALCLTCHGEEPYLASGEGSNQTNFEFHAKHLNGIADKGDDDNPDINSVAAGVGNAICAECHFRLHSTATVNPATQTIQGSRLVNFSPNVMGYPGLEGGKPTWKKTATGGSCTLICHGYAHKPKSY